LPAENNELGRAKPPTMSQIMTSNTILDIQ
jgi:hypothetical protein